VSLYPHNRVFLGIISRSSAEELDSDHALLEASSVFAAWMGYKEGKEVPQPWSALKDLAAANTIDLSQEW